MKPRKELSERQAYEIACGALLLTGIALGLLVSALWVVLGETLPPTHAVGGAIGLLFGGSLLAHQLPKGWRMKTYFKTDKLAKDTLAVSPVIAVILMVAITVVLAATVFVLVSDIGGNAQSRMPQMAFATDEPAGNITVTQAEDGLKWDAFTVDGCDTVPTGNVDAGDTLSECGGSVQIRHDPSNSLVYRHEF